MKPKSYRANRSFGAINQGERLTFEDPNDPVLVSLLGAGYLDPESGTESSSVPSEETFGTPSIVQEPPSE